MARKPARDERDPLDKPRPYMPGPGERSLNRREMPQARQMKRAVVESETGDTPESIAHLTRKDTPEYRDFLNRGSKARNGKVTATETGAKRMAQELDLERMTRARRLRNKTIREQKSAEKGRMT